MIFTRRVKKFTGGRQFLLVMGTFKYHMTLRGRGTFKYHKMFKQSECRHMGAGLWPNRHITFIVAKKV